MRVPSKAIVKVPLPGDRVYYARSGSAVLLLPLLFTCRWLALFSWRYRKRGKNRAGYRLGITSTCKSVTNFRLCDRDADEE